VPLEFTGDLRLAALDLAGFDGRFDPAVLEAAAREAVAAWAEAVDGDDRPLIRLAGEQTASRLLFPEPGRRSRLVIRAPRLRELRIVGLRPGERPPAMTVEATISARRYLESRATGVVLEGSRDRDATFTLVWDLRATANPQAPWRIAAVSAPFRFRSRLHRLRTQFVNEVQVILGRPSDI
jgi:hypothetical protein